MLYRVKQFIWAMTAKVTEEQTQYLLTYLSETEYGLFQKLKISEQVHCIKVAKGLEQATAGNQEMIRLGLLHDIGKIKYPITVFEKGMIVILDRLTKGKVRRLQHLKMVRSYYEHAQLGYELLSEIKLYDERFLILIKNHHQRENTDNQDLELLKKYDDLA